MTLLGDLSLRRRFNQDVLWNFGSFVAFGVCGVAVNVAIGASLGAAALGVFNQVFGIYMVLSQLAVFGVQFSVLKHLSHLHDDREQCSAAATTGLITAGAAALVVCAVALALRARIGGWLDSPAVAVGLAYAAPGLFFFSLNKVLRSVLNGMGRMRAFAASEALRAALLLACVLALVAAGASPETLPVALCITEAVMCAALVPVVHGRTVSLLSLRDARRWFLEHASFGLRGCLSGLLAEASTRVDVLMLGVFGQDSTVGVYSFASMLAEGFGQIPVVVRRNLDPLFGQCFAARDHERIERIVGRVQRVMIPAMAVLGVGSVAAYPVAMRHLVADTAFRESAVLFGVLMAGVGIAAVFRPFFGVLLQAGRPGAQTAATAIVVGANALLNLVLIPPLGMYGAAVASSAVCVLEAALVAAMAKRLLGISLVRPRTGRGTSPDSTRNRGRSSVAPRAELQLPHLS